MFLLPSVSATDVRQCVTPLHHVPNWEGVSVSNKWDCHYTPFQGQEAVDRAVRKLGHMGYNVALNNCETRARPTSPVLSHANISTIANHSYS